MINDNNLLVRKGVLNHSCFFFLYKFLLEKQQSDSSVSMLHECKFHSMDNVVVFSLKYTAAVVGCFFCMQT